MGGSPEGGAARDVSKGAPPSALPGISPSRGEIGSSCAYAIAAEATADIPAREALLDRAMGQGRRRKSSEKLRRGRRPSEGLAFVARDETGAVVGTVRLWDVALGEDGAPALLLGPLAVEPALKGAGIGTALMAKAVEEAHRLGHAAILLVGDAPYYARFGFSAEKTAHLAMPGPYERHRFLALELRPGALDGAHGTLRATGRKLAGPQPRAAAGSLRSA
ncbi:MAG: N-acetyltransferase [Rhizobiales bacterium]|nr:N-acetyltransferase [Hyphomicrobiales bacterium]